MSHPVINTVLFLSGARKAISATLEMSDVADKELAIDYIQNEASDIEIMNCLVEGELPDDKYDYQLEADLWEKYRLTILENFDMLSEFIDISALEDLTEGMGPLSLLGYSSQPSVLEFHQAEGKYLPEALLEAQTAKDIFWNTPKKFWTKKAKDAKKAYDKKMDKRDKVTRYTRKGQGSGGLEKLTADKITADMKRRGLRTTRSDQGSGGADKKSINKAIAKDKFQKKMAAIKKAKQDRETRKADAKALRSAAEREKVMKARADKAAADKVAKAKADKKAADSFRADKEAAAKATAANAEKKRKALVAKKSAEQRKAVMDLKAKDKLEKDKAAVRQAAASTGQDAPKASRWDKIKKATKGALATAGATAKKAGGAIKGAATGKYGKGVQAATIGAGVAGGAAAAYGAYKAYKARKKAKEEAKKKKEAAAKA